MIFLAFVVPLAIYFFILALLNRSRHPVMVPGTWDFAGVLFAASGLLILGGPAVLSGIYEQWRIAWLLGRTRILHELGDNWYFWITLWVTYFIMILAAAVLLLRRRRGLTSIYNTDRTVLEELLTPLLDRLGLEFSRNAAGRILIRDREAREENQHQNQEQSWVALDLESFPLMRHVTMRWSGEYTAIRAEVEGELAKVLADVHSADNPAAGWFMSLSVALFFLVFFGLLGFLFLTILQLLR